MPRKPLHSLLENLLKTRPVLTVFIDLILGTKKIKDRRTPPAWVPATGAQQIVEPLGHSEKQALPESLNCTHCCLPLSRRGLGVGQGSKNQEIAVELRFLLGIRPSSHSSEYLLH